MTLIQQTAYVIGPLREWRPKANNSRVCIVTLKYLNIPRRNQGHQWRRAIDDDLIGFNDSEAHPRAGSFDEACSEYRTHFDLHLGIFLMSFS